MDQKKNGELKTKSNNDSKMQSSDDFRYDFVRSKLDNFRTDILKEVDRRLSWVIDEVLEDIRKYELQTHEFRNFAKSDRIQHNPHESTWSNRIVRNQQEFDDTVSGNSKTSNGEKTSSTSTLRHRREQSSVDQSDHRIKQNTEEKKNKQKTLLPEKIFVTRESYLTALLEVDHMKTLYHIFLTIMMLFLLNSISYDYFVLGRVNFGLGTCKTGLIGIQYVFAIWMVEHVFVFTLYYAFKGWAIVRAKLLNQLSMCRFWSRSCLLIYIISQLVFYIVASYMSLHIDMAFVSAAVLMLESTRLLMKMHSFVRTNAPRVLQCQKEGTNTDNVVPSFSNYLYFLFAPTLLYRDNYPRTYKIRWGFALTRFSEVVAVAFMYAYIHERHIKANFGNYGLEPIDENSLIVKSFGMMLPSIMIFLSGFYMLLHAWLNFTSELLRFGDRMFYKDWWTSKTYDAYYRNWNVVVHDWLYEYIYKDFYAYVFKGNKFACTLLVFMVSAVVHEYIIGMALRLFFPVMFSFFGGLGVSLVFITRKAPRSLGNIIIWFTLIFGNGMLVTLYCMEYYARWNCQRNYNNWFDYLTPAVWVCYSSQGRVGN